PQERESLYRNQDWRARTKAGIDRKWLRRLASAIVQETEVHEAIRNRPTLAELADAQSTTPFDLLVDPSPAGGLPTRFPIATTNTDEVVIERLLKDPRCFLGLSDAGAHVTQLCDANYATHLLGHWVRDRGALPLEMAVWRLTGHPAQVYGLHDRGRITVGY